MTVNLGEHQVGFDAHTLGFPSIHGCMAIVVVLPEGLYGYHTAGGETRMWWDLRGPAFRQYIESKGGNLRRATRLYGVTHVDSARGWGFGVKKDFWKAELKAYADALGTRCRISGYNLDDGVGAGFHRANKSAYVEFEKFGSKCDVCVQTWEDVQSTSLPAANNPWGNNIRCIRNGALADVFGPIYDPITADDLTKISKTKLRG